MAQEVKGIVGLCRHVLTSRMHVAIASLGMGIPVTTFVYGGKFEGLYEHFGLRSGMLAPRDLAGEEALTHVLTARIRESGDEAAHIAIRLPHVLDLARRNYQGIGSSVSRSM